MMANGPSEVERVSLTPAESVASISTVSIPQEGRILAKREDYIEVPPQHSEGRMAIRISDWDRIKRDVSRVIQPSPNLSGLYYTLFSLSGSALIAWVLLPSTAILAPWVVPLLQTSACFSFLSGCGFALANRKFAQRRQLDIQEILEDMKGIESSFKGGSSRGE